MQDSFPSESIRRMSRGQVKFSALYPSTHVWPHTGPTNTRLRAHLPLKVPLPSPPHPPLNQEEGEEGNLGAAATKNKMRPQIGIRIADRILEWTEGETFVIDDSFEHEVRRHEN